MCTAHLNQFSNIKVLPRYLQNNAVIVWNDRFFPISRSAINNSTTYSRSTAENIYKCIDFTGPLIPNVVMMLALLFFTQETVVSILFGQHSSNVTFCWN